MAKETIGYILGISKRPYPVCNGDVITFGREAQNNVPLDDLMASRNHACVEVVDRKVFVRDLGSFNGTFVNRNRLQSGASVALNSGDEIRIGGKLFYFISEEAGLEPQKAAHTRSRDLSAKETLGWDNTYNAADEEVAVPAPAVPSVPGLATDLQTQKIRLNKAAPATLAGTISSGGLPQIIQFIHAGVMSGRLQVSGFQLSGLILFLDGQLYAANAGREQGTEAVYACALENAGAFSFDRADSAEIQKTPRNITENTMHVIFECCRRTDEGVGRS
jgi:hypothetical protein